MEPQGLPHDGVSGFVPRDPQNRGPVTLLDTCPELIPDPLRRPTMAIGRLLEGRSGPVLEVVETPPCLPPPGRPHETLLLLTNLLIGKANSLVAQSNSAWHTCNTVRRVPWGGGI